MTECITKEEAIKYIKEQSANYGRDYPLDTVDFLKERLNITEEDLK